MYIQNSQHRDFSLGNTILEAYSFAVLQIAQYLKNFTSEEMEPILPLRGH